MKIIKIISLIGTCSLLLACMTSEPDLAGASPGGITFTNVTSGKVSSVYAQAQEHCAKNGKNASMTRGSEGDGIVTFACN